MGVWKAGAQCAVALTFDLDAETLWLNGSLDNLNKTGLLSQGTYGPRRAVPLILEMLERRGVPATFFIPYWTVQNHQETIRAIVDAGCEVGHHGYIHEHPTNLDVAEEERILTTGIEVIERIAGARPVGYRSPAWEFSANTVDLLVKHGFEYSSNLMSDFVPWVHEGTGLVELPVQWILDDAPFFKFSVTSARPMSSAANVFQVWSEEFQGIYRHGGLFNLTMHPQIIGRPGRLLMLERFLDLVESYPGIWFAKLHEIAEYWRSR